MTIFLCFVYRQRVDKRRNNWQTKAKLRLQKHNHFLAIIAAFKRNNINCNGLYFSAKGQFGGTLCDTCYRVAKAPIKIRRKRAYIEKPAGHSDWRIRALTLLIHIASKRHDAALRNKLSQTDYINHRIALKTLFNQCNNGNNENIVW